MALKAPAKQGLKERGDGVTRQNGDLTVTVWQDSRPVVILATNSDPTITERVQRKKKDGISATINCPSSLAKYNQHMGGVDQNDKLRGYYHVHLNCRKYYKYIFWFLLDLAVINLYILYHERPGNRRLTLKDFQVSLTHELIDNSCGRKRMRRSSILPSLRRFCWEHFPMLEVVVAVTTATSTRREVTLLGPARSVSCSFAALAMKKLSENTISSTLQLTTNLCSSHVQQH